MLASTVQFSNNTQPEEHPASIRPTQQQTPKGPPPCRDRDTNSQSYMSCHERNTRVFSQDPTVHRYSSCRRNTVSRSTGTRCQCSTRELPPFHVWERNGLCQTIIQAPVCWYMFWRMLLRKEVIQPHLPVRLPCYDFTPIANPTFDSSLPKVRPLASGVTHFRGVTGGVYKARERIHPSVADLGLLATPTSWSRVADSNPN